MIGLRACVGSALIFLSAAGASPDYFPLHLGNQWVYRCSGFCGEPLPTVGITRVNYIGGRWYSLLEGFSGSQTWLRQDESGTLWALDAATGKENRWYWFFAAEGESFDTSAMPCSPRATMASRNYRYEGPAGAFPDSLRITYPTGACADAGLAEEVFYQWTGLMRRTETTIGGPRTYDLIYARTGGVTVISEPELHFSLSLDKSVYTANLMPPIDPNVSVPRMTARLTLRNTTDQPVALTFPTGQRYDLEIKDERGNVVYRWSDGKAFTQMFGEEQFGPGERDYAVVVRLADKQAKPLAAGKYTAVGWLTTSDPQAFRASVGFEIRHVY